MPPVVQEAVRRKWSLARHISRSSQQRGAQSVPQGSSPPALSSVPEIGVYEWDGGGEPET